MFGRVQFGAAGQDVFQAGMRKLAAAAISAALLSAPLFPTTASAADPREDLPAGVFLIKSDRYNTCAKAKPYYGTQRIAGVGCDSKDKGQRWTFDPTTRQVRNQDPAFAGQCLTAGSGSWLVMQTCSKEVLFGDPAQEWQQQVRPDDKGDTPVQTLNAYDGGQTVSPGEYWGVSITDIGRHQAISFLKV
ncbi:ricin-type beta-trefoil lectin domain protein [Streptomyces sp. NPDC057287]|uniref:ricin-type beta-trefoil lectin domain protein n=1 Tax=Streptomyces sp. NPDC057287 TaxID=3346086 RepID=UPI00362F2E56